MTEPAGSYIPTDISRYFRSQAFRAWGVTVAIVFVWVVVIVLAPVALETGWISISSPIYTFFSYICHQLPERSLYFETHPLAVCSRCFGVYFGLFAGLLAYPLWRKIDDVEPLPRIWLFLSLVPIGIDWSLTVFGIWENTHASRFITGLILGIACATYIVPAVVEIRRNLSLRRRSEA
ncbi:MAG: DUF2085 domain-containing protein [Acidobacteria bacterium]|nr:DUF2085 domain-containing protein [Acidobacteriota bacterium]